MHHIQEIPFTPFSKIFQSNRHHTLQDVLTHPHIKQTKIVMMEQIHSAKVSVVKPTGSMTILQTDAVITTIPNTTLIVKTADCLPILISTESGVIAAIHAGRKGTNQRILLNTLELLTAQFSIHNTVNIWFGPRICNNCYQIDWATDTHYDLVEENKQQLSETLSRDQYHLTIHEDCTLCNKDKYYSYRADAPLNGRLNYSAISLQIPA